MNSELQKYIQDARKAGKQPEDIRKELISAGWEEKEVNSFLNSSPKGTSSRHWNAGDSLFWFILVGFAVTGFVVLMAVAVITLKTKTSMIVTSSPISIDKAHVEEDIFSKNIVLMRGSFKFIKNDERFVISEAVLENPMIFPYSREDDANKLLRSNSVSYGEIHLGILRKNNIF